jgi:class 3 adenylate cyclase
VIKITADNSVNSRFYSTSDGHQKIEEKQKKMFEFDGKTQFCCVCFIDIVNSTKTTAKIPPSKISKFYSIFLNTMSNVVEQNGGIVVKTLGDAVLYYFARHDDGDMDYIQRTIACNFNLIQSRKHMNELLNEEHLPNISFRISAEYGKVIVATSSVSSVNEIFGKATAMCSMINHGAETNGLVIGEDMFMEAQSLSQYQYKPIEYSLPNSSERIVYQVAFR